MLKKFNPLSKKTIVVQTPEGMSFRASRGDFTRMCRLLKDIDSYASQIKESYEQELGGKYRRELRADTDKAFEKAKAIYERCDFFDSEGNPTDAPKFFDSETGYNPALVGATYKQTGYSVTKLNL